MHVSAVAVEQGRREADEKRQCGEPRATLVGAEIDGRAGLVGALLRRRLTLACLCVELCRLRVASRALLSHVVGCWVACAMYRRPTMVILNELYKLISGDLRT